MKKYVLNIVNLHVHKSSCCYVKKMTSRYGKREGDSIWEFKWDWDRPRKQVQCCRSCFTTTERYDLMRKPDASPPAWMEPYIPPLTNNILGRPR